MKAFLVIQIVGWVSTSSFVFAALMRGRAMQKIDATSELTSRPLLALLALAVGAVWLPIGLVVIAKAIARRRTRPESIAKHLDTTSVDAKLRKRFRDNARAEVARLQKEAKR